MNNYLEDEVEISMDLLHMQFLQILEDSNITTVFQPIISLRDGSILGYEALSRGPLNTALHNPVKLFEVAETFDSLWELELLCRTKALKALYEKQVNIMLFLNVNPNIMNDHKFINGFTKEYLKIFSIRPDNIVFEITERNSVKNYSNFINTINNYKNQEYKIAIDDVGAGYSGLNLITDIHPHFLKLDMNLIRGIDKDKIKKAMVKSMLEFSKLSNTDLVAEGIETKEELEVLIDIGIHYGQGYLIQKPNASFFPIRSEIIDAINLINSEKNYTYGYKLSNIHIGNICENTITINPDITVSQIDELIRKSSCYKGFCVVKEDKVIGVITKAILKHSISGQYGFSLNSNKNISTIMRTDFLAIDYKTPIDVAANLAMSRDEDSLYDFITITKDSHYIGIVTVKQLIEKTIEIEVINAKHLNPLTELPGNVMIEQCIEKCITSSKAYSILYFDIDNFKPYNDTYGFENGDKIIKRLSAIILKNIPSNEFVGHIGGDDFIAVLSRYDIDEICQNTIRDFDECAHSCYNKNDLANGFIISKNRHGIEELFPLLSLSIAVINNDLGNYNSFYGCHDSIYACSEQASKLKKKCKQIAGSIYLIEQRELSCVH